MAGTLPGVESARRRRFHRSGGSSDSPTVAAAIGSTRKSAFYLYTNSHETHHSSVSSQACQAEKLGPIAREAKERLDGRLRSQRKSEPKRKNCKESLKCVDERWLIPAELQTEVFGSKKSGLKKFSWAKLSWKALDQDECAICLERFKAGQTLVHPPCAHRFHSSCLIPWLENTAHCPCCRMGILT